MRAGFDNPLISLVGPAGLEPATRPGGGSCQCAALNRGREDGFVPLINPTCQMSTASPEASLPATAYFAWGCFRYFGLGARPRRSRGLSFPVMIFPDDDRGMACRTMASGPSSDGGGRRTRTFEAIRRLIYSQAEGGDTHRHIRTSHQLYDPIILALYSFVRHCPRHRVTLTDMG